MKLTPLDIQQQTFGVKFRGYDIQEVEVFLETVAQEMEEHINKINELNEELDRKNVRIGEYQNMEKTLKETLMIAQAASEDLKKNAQKAAEVLREQAQREAESMVNEAKRQAASILDEANTQMSKVLADLSDLKGKRIVIQEKLRSLLEMHLKLLEEESEDPLELLPNEPAALNE